MTSVALLIPVGARDGAARKANFSWVMARYTAHGWDPVVARCPTTPWSKAAAVNPAAVDVDADVIVVADADSCVTRGAFADTIRYAAADGYAVPAEQVRRLTPEATRTVLAGNPSDDLDPRLPVEGRHQLLEGGGIIAVRRDVWLAIGGGFDPRFTGWGGEDFALGCALYAATGVYPRRAPGLLWHLWHPPQTRQRDRLTPANEKLANRYRSAKHDRAAMTALLDEWRQ